jgi:hypothetical protein
MARSRNDLRVYVADGVRALKALDDHTPGRAE